MIRDRAHRAGPTVWVDGLIAALPIPFGLVALGVEVFDHFAQVTDLSLALASACLMAVLARPAITFDENLHILGVTRRQASTDALTGLPNRRSLGGDLEQALAEPEDGSPRMLALLDLDGFKPYNDTFGHPAGDALLARLGRRLGDESAPGAAATGWAATSSDACCGPAATGPSCWRHSPPRRSARSAPSTR